MMKPKKSLGQNFLTDKNILNKISNAIKIGKEDFILEIGPGTGALTEYLFKCSPKSFITVDLDERSIEFLNEKYSDSIKIIHSDIRKINLSDFIGNYDYSQKVIAGNIPYNISADIFFWLFENRNLIDRAILMVQKEVAQRLSSKKGNKIYGILSVIMSYVGSSKILFDVSPNCFYPKPKVTSSVVELIFDKQVNEKDFRDLLNLVKACFGQRRKVLKNSLRVYLTDLNNATNINKSEILMKYFNKRAEELDIADFVIMMNEIRLIKNCDEET